MFDGFHDLTNHLEPPQGPHVVNRGRDRVTQQEADARAGKFPDPIIRLLGAPVPARQTERGVILQGAMGSGKTLTILKLIASELLALRDPAGCRPKCLREVRF
jgi:hypothetical protein